jgi:hypothetical protein
MRIAIVLFGQPREYMKGYKNIMEFINKQKDCTFDFFYHTWSLNENEEYKHSGFRDINKDSLIFRKETLTHLQELYKPVSCQIENQNELKFDESLYKGTIAYNNTKESRLPHINNLLYHMYSRNKARDVFNEYLTKMGDTVQYDFVLLTRFDIVTMPDVDLCELDTYNTYVSDKFFPRKILPDLCIITPPKIFLEWFTIYDGLKDILDNKEVYESMLSMNEYLYMNPEELIFAKYIFHYKNIDNISFFRGGDIC